MASFWCPKKYDVFISFRGEDIRSTFISHLRSALSRHNIKAYVDDDNLEKGQEVWPSLCQAIMDSQLAIVVFSENYADSKWCLNELEAILHCRKTQGLVVIPVFYEVDPSDIRNHSGTYGEAISKHTDNPSIQNWKAALTQASNISGWDSRSRDYKNESQVIDKIVEDVSDKLSLRSPVEQKLHDLVQNEKSYAKVKWFLPQNQKLEFQKNFKVIGIWGMGGIGKTTIAKTMFSQLFPQFDAVCFLANVREESKRIGLTSLCDKLLSELLKEGHHKYNLAGSTVIMRRLGNKKVLIVLDDVDSLDQLDVFSGICNYVGPDSKLIMTTRNRHLLRGRVDGIYEVKTWSFAKSLELFCLHAFKKRHPIKGYEDLSKRAVTYAGGVPLALKVLGSNLYFRSTEFWDSELSKLMNCPNDRIQNVLQVSYDGLDNLEKKIFLDIAFFFKGEHKDDVIRILDACGFYATSGVKVLEDKALINISYSGTIQMHDLIQEMGLNIVRGGNEDLGRRSRLRDIEEVSDVLENKKGSDVVEGLQLDLSSIEDIDLNVDTFNMMTNLRVLRLYVPSGKRSGNVHRSGILSKLSGKLRYLEWNGCHLKSLPVTFCAKMLVEIRMPQSHVTKLWQGVQDVANLVRIDLSECKYLKNLPDLSKASKLKWVNLSGCESLCDIHPSIFLFDTLETLMLDGCKKVESLKSEKHLTCLKKISVNGCTSLREFSLSSDSIRSLDLSSTGIEMLDSSFGRLINLKSLNVQGLRHGNLPNELFSLKGLQELMICNCRLAIDKQKLHVLFDVSRSLQLLHLKDCSNLRELPDNIDRLSRLYELRLDGSFVKTLPDSIKNLYKLKTLSLENCTKLESLPELPTDVTKLSAVNCRSLLKVYSLKAPALILWKFSFFSFQNCFGLDEPSLHCIMDCAYLVTKVAMCHNILVKCIKFDAKTRNYKFVKFCFPGSRVPGQFKYRTRHSSITIDLPSSQYDILGLIFCVVLSPSRGTKNTGAKIWCECYMASEPVAVWYHEAVTGLNSDHVFMWFDSVQIDNIFKIYESGERRVSFEFFLTNDTGECVIECGVSIIFDWGQHLHRLIHRVNPQLPWLELNSQHGEQQS